MTNADEKILTTVCNYMRLVKPEENIPIIGLDVTKYIFINGPLMEFIRIFCKHGTLVLQATDIMEIPSWFKELFHLERISSLKAERVVPSSKLGGYFRYYKIEVKDKELLK